MIRWLLLGRYKVDRGLLSTRQCFLVKHFIAKRASFFFSLLRGEEPLLTAVVVKTMITYWNLKHLLPFPKVFHAYNTRVDVISFVFSKFLFAEESNYFLYFSLFLKFCNFLIGLWWRGLTYKVPWSIEVAIASVFLGSPFAIVTAGANSDSLQLHTNNFQNLEKAGTAVNCEAEGDEHWLVL